MLDDLRRKSKRKEKLDQILSRTETEIITEKDTSESLRSTVRAVFQLIGETMED